MPPLLYYLSPNPLIKRFRVIFLLWTSQVSQVVPTLDISTLLTTYPTAISIPPIPYILYMQLHSWTWFDSLLQRDPDNRRASRKRSNSANDVIFLLPLAFESYTKFRWLSENFMAKLQENANRFIRAHPRTYTQWVAMNVEVEPAKARASQALGGLEGSSLNHTSKALVIRAKGPSYNQLPDTSRGLVAKEDALLRAALLSLSGHSSTRGPSAHYSATNYSSHNYRSQHHLSSPRPSPYRPSSSYSSQHFLSGSRNSYPEYTPLLGNRRSRSSWSRGLFSCFLYIFGAIIALLKTLLRVAFIIFGLIVVIYVLAALF